MNYNEEYRRWCECKDLCEDDRAELLHMSEDEIKQAFGAHLSFGTAGLRGVMSLGTNRMNTYTVMQATAGLADYILSLGMQDRGVVIGCDTRINSEWFTRCAAAVLAGMGVKCYLFDSMRPTPVLSFAIRELGCIAGINITASHNPKQYNGYKAYWEDGAQLSPEQAKQVEEYIRARDVLAPCVSASAVPMALEQAIADGRVTVLDATVDEKYFACVLSQLVDPELLERNGDMKLVYTPLHGTGRVFVPRVLLRAGMKNILTVPEQMDDDGSFPTVKFPNPEFPEVFALGIAIAKENGCDLVIATDPDADRVGIMAKNQSGEFVTLSGNQTGVLLLDYIIRAMKEKGNFPSDAYAVKSIVTTELASRICKAQGATMFDVLTGFKFIGEVIKKHEAEGKGTYLLGFEESYGYLKGTYARDKDAVVASLLIVEMAAYYREKGMTLCDALEALFRTYGYSAERVVNLTMEGIDGSERMAMLMKSLRENPPTALAGEKIVCVRDYLAETITYEDGRVEGTGLPKADVLYYTAQSGNTLVVRPSGTEPKVKLYVMAFGEDAKAAEDAAKRMENFAREMTRE